MLDLHQQPFFATNHTPESVARWIDRHDPETKVHLLTLQGIYWNAICAALAQAHVDGKSLRIGLDNGDECIFVPGPTEDIS